MDDREIAKALPHLAFDVHHFCSYVRLHREGTMNLCSPIIAQGVRYALLLHFRVLLNFFCNPPKQDDRCISELKTVAWQLNKRLAHFTASRWEEEEEVPDMAFYEKYFPDLERLITAFRTGLPDEMRQRFADALGYWERVHPAVIQWPRTHAVTRATDSDACGSPTLTTFSPPLTPIITSEK